MAIRIDIKAEGMSPKSTARERQTMVRSTMYEIAYNWHADYSAGHFTPAGARKYGYKRRKSKNIFTGTIKTKGVSPSHRPKSGDPLVWTGDTKEAAKTRTIKASFRKSSVSHPSMGHLNRYVPKGFRRGQLRYEYTRVLNKEENELAKSAERSLRDRFTRNKKNVRVSTFRRPPKPTPTF